MLSVTQSDRSPPGVGDTAPRFSLQGVHNGEIKGYDLHSLLDDGYLLLGVYVFDFSPVCTTQMCQLSDMGWYEYKNELTIAGVSSDSPYSHIEFSQQEGIDFPLLCDTAGELLDAYGVLNAETDGLKRVPQRALFLINPDATIEYRWVAADNWDEGDFGVNPVEDAIEAI